MQTEESSTEVQDRTHIRKDVINSNGSTTRSIPLVVPRIAMHVLMCNDALHLLRPTCTHLQPNSCTIHDICCTPSYFQVFGMAQRPGCSFSECFLSGLVLRCFSRVARRHCASTARARAHFESEDYSFLSDSGIVIAILNYTCRLLA